MLTDLEDEGTDVLKGQ